MAWLYRIGSRSSSQMSFLSSATIPGVSPLGTGRLSGHFSMISHWLGSVKPQRSPHRTHEARILRAGGCIGLRAEAESLYCSLLEISQLIAGKLRRSAESVGVSRSSRPLRRKPSWPRRISAWIDVPGFVWFTMPFPVDR